MPIPPWEGRVSSDPAMESSVNLANILVLWVLVLVGGVAAGCTGLHSACERTGLEPAVAASPEVVVTAEVEWQQLNPARGEMSPKAGALWGDRTGPGAAGFLLKPIDGFLSPPHIHNVAYRGVVIRGAIHNDDPDAEPMYMPTGSFWTQPAGGVHVTGARGSTVLAYIEVDDAFRVLPAERAFVGEDRPINVHATNLVWVPAPGASAADGARIAYLWGDPQGDQPSGVLVKLPSRFAGTLRGQGSTFRGVVIEGRLTYEHPAMHGRGAMAPGSYFGSTDGATHEVACGAELDCVIYARMEGRVEVVARDSER